MKTARIKAPQLESRLEFERAIDEIAAATVTLRALEAKRDEAIQYVRKSTEEAIGTQAAIIERLTLLAQNYANVHREELLPGKAKSAETPLAFFGFRTGMPALRLLSKWTWEKVVAALTRLRLQEEYVVVTLAPAKAKIIADLTQKGALSGGVHPGDVGVRIEQAESFFIEPKERAEEVRP